VFIVGLIGGLVNLAWCLGIIGVTALVKLVSSKGTGASGTDTSYTLIEVRARCLAGVLLSRSLSIVGVGCRERCVAVVSVEERSALESTSSSSWFGRARVNSSVTCVLIFRAAVADDSVVNASTGKISPVGMVLGRWCSSASRALGGWDLAGVA
jgi:hypothetical protein